MIRFLLTVIAALGLFLSLTPSAGAADPYPSVYRGVAEGERLRLFAHFLPSFLSKGPKEQERLFRETAEALESLQTLKNSDPRVTQPEGLHVLVGDRPGDLYDVVVGIHFFQARAKTLRMVERPERCGTRLSVEIEADWVVPEPPLEKEEPPPFLEAHTDPDGLLAFKGGNFDRLLDEFHQTKFQRVRFPKDLPEGLRPKFREETARAETGGISPSFLLYAPQTGFLPLEVALWREDLSENTLLLFFYQKRGEWKGIPFPFAMSPPRAFQARAISRFDLNGNGEMEYLVELAEENQTRRVVYEVNEEAEKAALVAAAEDNVVIRKEGDPKCRGSAVIPPPKESPLPLPSPSPGREGP